MIPGNWNSQPIAGDLLCKAQRGISCWALQTVRQKGCIITFTKSGNISRIFFGNFTKTLLTIPVMFARIQIEQMKATIKVPLNTKNDGF